MIFADVETLGWAALGTTIATVIGAAGLWYIKIRKQFASEITKDREEIRKGRAALDQRWQETVQRLELEVKLAREDNRKCMEERATDRQKVEEMATRLDHLEQALQEFVKTRPKRKP